ncbi:MAG: methyltransferase domain-containing protein [Proteobacteria bacterium]|nr:methyltransferase domain-containing protein [Pseudomonadota bacterium]MBU1715669.1 methyltransferase domain-containing protein [Pseudomonadota bacterium]
MISRKQIVDYYDSCEIDYRMNWHLDECLALHIGYWDKSTKTLAQALVRQNEIMGEKGRITASDRVLDAGCGVGGSSIFLAKSRGCQVVGITLSHKQARSATGFARKKGVHEQTDFQVMDYTNTGFADESFDVVWALESSCYAASKKTFINEAYRILKKGGRLIVADGFESKDTYSPFERKIFDLWIKRWAVDALEPLPKFRQHLSDAGFIKINYEDITKNVTPSSRRLFALAIVTWPLAKMAQALGKRSKIQNDNLAGAFFQYLVLKLNLGSYGMFYAEKK